MTHSRPLLAVALALAVPGPVGAQYNPYYPAPPYPGYGRGVGGALAGSAQVIQAQGQVAIQNEQARVERQKYYQEKTVTKKMAFDEAAYEKANTATFTESQEQVMSTKLRRIMNQASPAEIISGDTLNSFMPYLRTLVVHGTPGSPLPLNPYLLKAINVAPLGAGGVNAGMLKDGGKLVWPIQIRGPLQKKMDGLLPSAVQEAVAGTLELKTYNQVKSLVQSMLDDVRAKYRKEEIDGQSFLKGKRFLDDLDSSLSVLQDPQAALYLSGAVSARGSNVQELVENMSSAGLKFAPASPGADSAYFSLHDSFVAYARAAQSSAGIQTMLAPSANPYRKTEK